MAVMILNNGIKNYRNVGNIDLLFLGLDIYK